MVTPILKAGDRIKDLTFDPPLDGVVLQAHERREGAYWIKLDESESNVVVHSRNLQFDPPEK